MGELKLNDAEERDNATTIAIFVRAARHSRAHCNIVGGLVVRRECMRMPGAPLLATAVVAVALCGVARADNYKVDFDGKPWYVHVHPCQGQDARCGRETNNFASHTLACTSASPRPCRLLSSVTCVTRLLRSDSEELNCNLSPLGRVGTGSF